MVDPGLKPRRRPAWLWPAVRIVISLALLIALALQLNVRQIGEAMLDVGVGTFALAVSLIFVISVPMAQRWRLIIASDGHHLSFLDVWSSVLIGMFFNQVLPTTVGGDVVRGAYAHFAGLPVASAVKTVFIDRMIGLLVLVFVVIPSLAFLLYQRGPTLVLPSLVVVIALALIGFTVVFALDRLAPVLLGSVLMQSGTGWRGQLARIVRTLIEISPQIRRLVMERQRFIAVLILSILGQSALFAVIVIFTNVMDGSVGALDVLTVVPASMLLSNIPISIAGWGVREGVMIGAMALVGVGAQQAVTVAILFGLAQLFASLPGGLVWWIVDRRRENQSRREKQT